MNRRGIYCVVLAGLLLVCQRSYAVEPSIHSGDRIVFLGDAITQQQVYTRYVMNCFASQFPGMVVSFRNAGLAGDGECDRTPGGLRRLDRDVLSLNPTWACIAFGMNDAGYQAFDQRRYDEFLSGLTAIVKELKERHIHIVLMTPGCVDPGFKRNGIDGREYNRVLQRYADGVKELATKENLAVADVHDLLCELTDKASAETPPVSLIPNPLQPSPVIHAAMAFALMKTLQGETPVSEAVIDATTGRTVAATRCTIMQLTVNSNTLSFVRADKAIPAWLDPGAQPVYRYSSLASTMNRYGLTVKGLAEGDWQLAVEGTNVAVFSSAQLSAGINLAFYPGPWQALGAQINGFSADAEAFYNHIWWDVKTMWWLPAEADAECQRLLDHLQQLLSERDAVRNQAAARIPPWQWVLTRVSKKS